MIVNSFMFWENELEWKWERDQQAQHSQHSKRLQAKGKDFDIYENFLIC